jgi:hypothetical protein
MSEPSVEYSTLMITKTARRCLDCSCLRPTMKSKPQPTIAEAVERAKSGGFDLYVLDKAFARWIRHGLVRHAE